MNRCLHDWGTIEVKSPIDPRRSHNKNTRPGDKCRRCGLEKPKRIDWDVTPFTNQPVPGIYKKYQDRSKYLADGRKK